MCSPGRRGAAVQRGERAAAPVAACAAHPGRDPRRRARVEARQVGGRWAGTTTASPSRSRCVGPTRSSPTPRGSASTTKREFGARAELIALRRTRRSSPDTRRSWTTRAAPAPVPPRRRAVRAREPRRHDRRRLSRQHGPVSPRRRRVGAVRGRVHANGEARSPTSGYGSSVRSGTSRSSTSSTRTRSPTSTATPLAVRIPRCSEPSAPVRPPTRSRCRSIATCSATPAATGRRRRCHRARATRRAAISTGTLAPRRAMPRPGQRRTGGTTWPRTTRSCAGGWPRASSAGQAAADDGQRSSHPIAPEAIVTSARNTRDARVRRHRAYRETVRRLGRRRRAPKAARPTRSTSTGGSAGSRPRQRTVVEAHAQQVTVISACFSFAGIAVIALVGGWGAAAAAPLLAVGIRLGRCRRAARAAPRRRLARRASGSTT